MDYAMKNFENAFVHPFATAKNYYLYDVNTNSIVQVSKNIFLFYKQNGNIALQHEEIAFLQALCERGLLKENKIRFIEHPVTKILESYLERKVSTVTLQLTQQCNLRCKYCAYSGKYDTRTHSSKKMSIDVAKRSISFLIEHSIDVDPINIGFYGGEPLLYFDMIKELVDFSKEIGEGKNITYSITTNGTLFNDENITFMEKNNFFVMVSLDGPEEIHDKNRVFAANGKGTYSTIMKNIKYIKEKYPQFYSQISFNAVIDPTVDRSCASQFFMSCKELEGAVISASIISPTGLKNKLEIDEKFYLAEDIEYFKVLLNKLGRVADNNISKLTKNRFEEMLAIMHIGRPHTVELPEITHPSGPCIPGARKLLIDTEGFFYPCESVPETPALQIGHLDNGFDIEKIKKLLNIGKLTEKTCRKCWGIRLCSQCCLTAATSNGLSKEQRLSECQTLLQTYESDFKDICTLRDYGVQI